MVAVSRETEAKLLQYVALLKKWQQAINLVSKNTLETAWERHIQDSLQLVEYLPESTKSLIDFGSGAGFPGLVLAIALPNISVSLIESDQKKCSFLSAVSRETDTKATIINERIETQTLSAPDVITARALASLKELLNFCTGYAQENPKLILLFPKGASAEEEISEAKALYDFNYKIMPSQTDKNGKILIITSLTTRAG